MATVAKRIRLVDNILMKVKGEKFTRYRGKRAFLEGIPDKAITFQKHMLHGASGYSSK